MSEDTKRYGLGSWGRQAPLPAKEGGDRGSQAGDRAVGAVGQHEGVALLLRTLYHIAAATSPPPPQSLPLRRMLCSPGIQHSRRSQLSREGSPCGGASSVGFPVGRRPGCGTATAIEGGERLLTRTRCRRPGVKLG